jgi:DnaJ domain
MYLYYEQFLGPLGINDPSTITEVILSAFGQKAGLNWKSKTEKATSNLLIHVFKQTLNAKYVMDPKTYIWTFIGPSGVIIINSIQSMNIQGIFTNLHIKEITDLEERLKRGRLDKPLPVSKEPELKFKEEDFFYSPSVTSNEISGQALYDKLSPLLDISSEQLLSATEQELKKYYRKAALKFHPDRNNGDGSKMSELNMYWGIFNAGVRV